MSTISFDVLKIKMANLGPESTVPAVFKTRNIQQISKSYVEEDDGLYVGYGFIDDIFPYRKQNRYTRNMTDTELPTVVLENEYLKAVFLPTLGARLWQLFDKKSGKDLMLTNEEIAFGNLAIRDAWFCGGTEWNFGVIGHSPFTCATVHTATLTTDDGTPVVRFYEYERVRGCTYQMDCWLPGGSERLYVGVRLVNPTEETTPTYWWSNIAVSEDPNGRVIIPASEAFTSWQGAVLKEKELQTAEKDITYPIQNEVAVDHFWKTRDAEYKYVAHVDRDGYGLCQASSSAQKGRKLFAWGQGRGADNWQKLLRTEGTNGHYIEIQAGLGQTQYECIPMPPNTAWEWVESYGAIQMNPTAAHGDFEDAKAEANRIVASYNLEEVLKSATHMKKAADKVVIAGSGWGALEEKLRENKDMRPLSYNLDFGEIQEEQKQWLQLIKEGTLGQHSPDEAPPSWIYSDDILKLLECAVEGKDHNNWYTYLHLGVIYHARGDLDKAEKALKKSIALRENAWAHYAVACLKWKQNEDKAAVKEALRALEIKADDVSLARAVTDILAEAGENKRIIVEVEKLSDEIRRDGCIRLNHAIACVAVGDTEKAEELVGSDPEFCAAYVREGNRAATRLWIDLQTEKLKKQGMDTSKVDENVPTEWDFRMQ